MNLLEWDRVLAYFLLPPGVLILLAALGFAIYSKWRAAAIIMIGSSLVLLLALSVPLTARELMAPLETFAQPLYADSVDELGKKAQVIVVLGGGRYADAPEYGSDTVNRFTLERLRYAARLQKKTGLPILVSGGAVRAGRRPEAELMAAVLREEYKITPRWRELRSRTTLDNAVLSAQLLEAAGLNRVVLVTHAWHMRRAAWSFKQMGISVTAAPLGFTTLSDSDRGILGYLPSAKGLYWTSVALRERLGYWWYRMIFDPDRVRQQPDTKSKSP